MKKSTSILLVIIILLVAAGVWYAVSKSSKQAPIVATSFEECVKAGYPVMESYPRQCKTDTAVYVEKVPEKITYVNASEDKIVVELPFPGAVTGKEFSVIGKARGPWYFEASFPIEVLDKDNKVLTTGIAQAQGEWMTEEFVPFKADIKIPNNYMGPATLVLKKDNPSALPENDASASFAITIEY